ncbi:MAG: hypothetical protein II073_03615 [Lachnospiraceae bacterium]|nr:hypothetical protein [Lachnospiraceae bacterium]
MEQLWNTQLWEEVLMVVCMLGMSMYTVMGITYGRLVGKTLILGNKNMKWESDFRENVERTFFVSGNVNNVDKFVDKYVMSQKIMGIILCTWERICGQIAILSLFIAAVTIGLDYLGKCGRYVTSMHEVIDIVLFMMWITCYFIWDIRGKKKQIRVYLHEYLENVLLPGLRRQEDFATVMGQYQNANQQKVEQKEKKGQLSQTLQKKEKAGQLSQTLQKKEKTGKPVWHFLQKESEKKQELDQMKQALVEELAIERRKREKEQKQRILQASLERTNAEALQEKVSGKQEPVYENLQVEQKQARKEKGSEEKESFTKDILQEKDTAEVLQDLLNEYLDHSAAE